MHNSVVHNDDTVFTFESKIDCHMWFRNPHIYIEQSTHITLKPKAYNSYVKSRQNTGIIVKFNS